MVAWLGVLIGIVGVVILVGIKNFSQLKQDSFFPFWAVIIASILWSFTAILSTKIKKPSNKKLDVSVQIFVGGMFNLMLSLLTNELSDFSTEAYTTIAVSALLYLTVFGSIFTLLAFNFLLDNVRPGLVLTYSYVNPIIALILGWLILNEEINLRIILASGLVILSIFFIKLGQRKPLVHKVIETESTRKET